MDPSPSLISELHDEEVEDARRQTFAQKFMAGAELFDYAVEISRSGIRMQNPGFSEPEVEAELARRLAIGDRS
jgi:hypothetical protein